MAGGTVSDSVEIDVVNRPPKATIFKPADGSTFGSDQLIELQGSAYDQDESIPVSNHIWNSSLDGEIFTGTQTILALSEGSHVITLSVTDGLGAVDTDSVTIEVGPASGLPSVFITTAAFYFPPDSSVQFQGAATDPEDGILTGTALQWSVDGIPIGSGASVSTTLTGPAGGCGWKSHVLTLTATDSNGNTTSISKTIYAGTVC
jgi:hypothetical protein